MRPLWRIAMALAVLGGVAQAGTVQDNFNVSHDYLAAGVSGTIWDGLYTGAGSFPNQTTTNTAGRPGRTLVADANLTVPGMLTVESTDTAWESNDDGFFLFKNVSGDFQVSAQIVRPFDNTIYNTAGLMARMAGPDGAPPAGGEDFVSWTRFNEFNYANYLRSALNGAVAQINPGDFPNPKYWLRMDRVNGTNFNFYEKAQETDDWQIVTFPAPVNGTNLVRPDLAGAVLQVGIIHATFFPTLLQAQFENFSLTGASVDDGEARFVIQPQSQTVVAGEAATFTAALEGSPPFSLQWFGNNRPLAGQTNLTLTFPAALGESHSTYQLFATNLVNGTNFVAAGDEAGLTVLPLSVLPGVTIRAPSPNERTTNTLVSGAASDATRVTGVVYWFTNINNGIATTSAQFPATLQGANAKHVTWSATAAFPPGTNILVAQSQDAAGFSSRAVSRTFFHKAPSLFTLTEGAAGMGRVTGRAPMAGDVPPTNGALLNIGETYSLTALPARHSSFSNWTGTIGTVTNRTLHFTMEPGTAIQANFVSNLLSTMAGTYNGLFYRPGATELAGVTEGTAGMLRNLALAPDGSYSAQLLLQGTNYRVSGGFDSSGQSRLVVPRPAANGGSLNVALSLLWNTLPRQITGVVSPAGGAWRADLQAIATATNPIPSVEYTLLVPPRSGTPQRSPTGFGYGLITNHAGIVTLAGKLADGTSYSQTVPVTEALNFPVYVSLTNSGLLLGWLTVDQGALGAQVPAGPLAWITKTFAGVVTAEGSVWTNPLPSAPAFPVSAAQLEFFDGGLASPVGFPVTINVNGINQGGPIDPDFSVSGSINPNTGLVSVEFLAGLVSGSGQGVILQASTNGGGFFIGQPVEVVPVMASPASTTFQGGFTLNATPAALP